MGIGLSLVKGGPNSPSPSECDVGPIRKSGTETAYRRSEQLQGAGIGGNKMTAKIGYRRF
ncbi:hypothetical protein AM571_PC01708 (plasmid) [Rhizobium etli 8C-3]|uniref:Uncharacterized protein n=1 Tax=Rhizobium etli 8C-3 TaxID=538025 RepID=A0A1L5PGN4_RHIET|nr:hypothetical protein AM571_PC01708 [Rhizobium etli 8C-3]